MSQTRGFQYQDIVFLAHFEDLPDPRQAVKVLYPLSEVLLLTLFAVLCGADSWVEIAKFGEKRRVFLRRFAPFENGTPSHDQLGDIFAALDPQAFQSCFVNWVSSLTGLSGAGLSGDVVAIDGKTLRRTYRQAGRKGAIVTIDAMGCQRHIAQKIRDKEADYAPVGDANCITFRSAAGPERQSGHSARRC